MAILKSVIKFGIGDSEASDRNKKPPILLLFVFTFSYLYFMCVGVFPAYVCVHSMHA